MKKYVSIAIIGILVVLLGMLFFARAGASAEILEGYNSTLSYSSSNAAVYSKFAMDKYVEATTATTPGYEPVSTAFAFKTEGVRVGSSLSAEVKQALTGDPNRYLPITAAEQSDLTTTVSVPVWVLNTSTGAKTASTASVTVHKLLADDVVGIFTTIFNDPEQFPVQVPGSIRGLGTQSLHCIGAAIDINANENPFNGDGIGGTPVGDVKYLDPENRDDNELCIPYNGSVVRAFAKYGWGWASGTWMRRLYALQWDWTQNKWVSTQTPVEDYDPATFIGRGTGYTDLMHFSILNNGG